MSILRGILAVVLGMVVGSVVNMALVMAGGHVIAPPVGADLTTAEGLQAAMPLLQPRHFVFPFLAHALGTLVGAFVATKVASGGKRVAALVVTALFFAGALAGLPAVFLAIAHLEILHEVGQCLHPCLGHGVVDRSAHAAKHAMALERDQAGFRGFLEEGFV